MATNKKLSNGHYLLKHKMLDVEYNLTVYNGNYKLLSCKKEFIKYTSAEKVNEFCDVIKKLPAQDKRWNIVYYVNGKVQEIINLNASYGIAQAKIKDLKRISYKIGKLIAVQAI